MTRKELSELYQLWARACEVLLADCAFEGAEAYEKRLAGGTRDAAAKALEVVVRWREVEAAFLRMVPADVGAELVS